VRLPNPLRKTRCLPSADTAPEHCALLSLIDLVFSHQQPSRPRHRRRHLSAVTYSAEGMPTALTKQSQANATVCGYLPCVHRKPPLTGQREQLQLVCRYLWSKLEGRLADNGGTSTLMAPPPPPPSAELAPGCSTFSPEETMFLTVATSGLEVKQLDPLPPLLFRGGESMMRLIIEYRYFGQLQLLEDAVQSTHQMPLCNKDFDLVTRLLTWCARCCQCTAAMCKYSSHLCSALVRGSGA
jgi:hypothetical protein